MNLRNKVSLITGGSRMGLAIATALAERGAHVALTYRTSRKTVYQIAKAVERHRREALVVKADLRNERDITRLISSIHSRFGRLDVLVNMASIYQRTPFSKLNSNSWDQHLNANLTNYCFLSLEASRLMKKQGMGRIINVSDWLAASGRPRYRDYLPYYVSKTGVLGLTEAMALELAPEVLVNCIAPGPMLPPRGMKFSENRQVIKATPLKRWGGPEEIAKAVLFLIDSEFVTGECIRVDGGRHLH